MEWWTFRSRDFEEFIVRGFYKCIEGGGIGIMQSLERDLEGDFSAKVSYTRNGSLSCAVPFSPLLLIETISRKSFSYNKLPQEPLELTILKLDGSCFGIISSI